MEQNRADQQLRECLSQKLINFDLREPYVWRLQLTEADFSELERCLQESITAHQGSRTHLFTPEFAPKVLIYLAEWYKRCYSAEQREEELATISFESSELKAIWEASGINLSKYVYTNAESTMRLWKYSTYVLGGLAIKHELNRNDDRFLKALCRVLHGEACTLENLDEAGRAIAFRQSIRMRHALYAYLTEILNGNLPFAEEDLNDSSSDVNQLIARIKSANDEVLRAKFRLEWVITFRPEYDVMNRRLRLWLKPEEVGGGLHQYLRYDRVHLWGVPHPEKQKRIRVGVRFRKGVQVVAEADFNRPIMTYLNTGDSETGFVAWSLNDFATCRNIPTANFDRVEILVMDDAGKIYSAQEQPVEEYLQLFRITPWGDEWSSLKVSQRDTALLFSERCNLELKSSSELVYRKPFRDAVFGDSVPYGWYPIYESATLTDDAGKTFTFYNRNGYDQIYTRLYLDTIRYVSGGKVVHQYVEDPNESELLESDELPLIFGKDDLLIRHFATKDAVKQATPLDEGEPELIEFKSENGRYQVWSGNDKPSFGAATLRITIKGRQLTYRVFYAPGILNETAGAPIVRDFEKQTIRYAGLLGHKACVTEFQDCIERNGKPLQPYITLKIGEDTDYVLVDVYRPTLLKEVCVEGSVFKYIDNNEVLIPYLLKECITVNDFSAKGYQSYDCGALTSIYKLLSGMANDHLAAWQNGDSFKASLLDPSAPECLKVWFGEPNYNGEPQLEFYYWNYDQGTDPQSVEFSNEVGKNAVIFQSMNKLNHQLVNVCPQSEGISAFTYRRIPISIVKCFDVALHHKLYFFSLLPFTQIKDPINQLYNPLLEDRAGVLTEEDKRGLIRYAEEFRFNWEEKGIKF